VSVENGLDELWIGVKGQSNLDIAGSPRNAFRSSVVLVVRGGRALNGLGVSPDYRTQSNSEYRGCNHGSERAGDKLRTREGNNPDRQLRSQIYAQW